MNVLYFVNTAIINVSFKTCFINSLKIIYSVF